MSPHHHEKKKDTRCTTMPNQRPSIQMVLCQYSTVLRMSLAGTLSHLPPHFGLAMKLRRAAFGVESVGAVVCQREHLHATHAKTFMQVQNPSNRTANSLGLASGTQSTKLEKKVNSCRTFAIKHGMPNSNASTKNKQGPC